MNRRMLSFGAARRLAMAVAVAVIGSGALAGSAAAALKSHGQRLKIAPSTQLNANQSSNWFGYNQGALEQGGKLFNSITGDWKVPTASQHKSGQAEYSSDWIGIGGGCIDANCTTTDNTLIQTGTEQDVSSGGKASYSAWWEIIPAPSISISMTVHPGDNMHAAIAEAVPFSNVWTITLKDVTRNETFTQTVPYTSSHATAEWIEETPLIIGTGAGFAALPKLTNPNFDNGTTNGANAHVKSSEKMLLVNNNNHVIGAPSSPDSDTNGFGACAWASSCSPPGS